MTSVPCGRCQVIQDVANGWEGFCLGLQLLNSSLFFLLTCDSCFFFFWGGGLIKSESQKVHRKITFCFF